MAATARTEEHVGEWQLAITADSPHDLFVEAALVVARACGDTEGDYGEWQDVSLSARDVPTLLADWMNDLIGRSEVEGRAFDDIWIASVHEFADRATLEARVRGKTVASWRSPIKAATYHDLAVERDGRTCRATVLLDV